MPTIESTRTHRQQPTERSAGRSVVGWIQQVIAWTVILGVLFMITAAVLVPRLGGATPYTILTGSMTPKMPPGTLVVVKPRPIDKIGIGDVITYQFESGSPPSSPTGWWPWARTRRASSGSPPGATPTTPTTQHR